MLVTIVIPALDEEEGLPRVFEALPLRDLREQGHQVQVIVVDGGSTDGTRDVAAGYGARVLRFRRGYGRQYRAALAEVPHGVIVTLDADGSYPAGRISEFVELLLARELDFLSVSRMEEMTPEAMSRMHRFGNAVLSLTMRWLFRVEVKDSQSGMWIFRQEILPFLNLHAEGMAFSEEIKIEAFTRFRALEVPGAYTARIGQAKIRSFRDGLGNLFYLFFKKARGLVGRP